MTVQVQLPLLLWREDKKIVAYSPALEISSFGETEESAVSNFSEAVELFFETADERKVLRELLENLGWTFKSNTWNPNREPLQGSRTILVEVPLAA